MHLFYSWLYFQPLNALYSDIETVEWFLMVWLRIKLLYITNTLESDAAQLRRALAWAKGVIKNKLIYTLSMHFPLNLSMTKCLTTMFIGEFVSMRALSTDKSKILKLIIMQENTGLISLCRSNFAYILSEMLWKCFM